MKLTDMDRQASVNEKKAGSSQPAPARLANDGMISQLFRAYFNNKMTLMIFLIQAKLLKLNPQTIDEISRFLDDIFHHMLTAEAQQQYQPAFESLKSFFRLLPDVSEEQREGAKALIRDLYHAVGIDFKVTL